MDRDQAALEELAARLWDERRIVTWLLYKLTVSGLLLAADERRFVPDALREVDETVALLRDGEHHRERAVQQLATHWRVDPRELTLGELSRRAPAPFDEIFADHLAAFGELASEVDAVAETNRTLARSELAELTGTLSLLTGTEQASPATYDATGALAGGAPVGARLREVL